MSKSKLLRTLSIVAIFGLIIGAVIYFKTKFKKPQE